MHNCRTPQIHKLRERSGKVQRAAHSVWECPTCNRKWKGHVYAHPSGVRIVWKPTTATRYNDHAEAPQWMHGSLWATVMVSAPFLATVIHYSGGSK